MNNARPFKSRSFNSIEKLGFFLIVLLLCSNNLFAAPPTTEWAIYYNGLANVDDSTVKVVHDSSGNIYVTGSAIEAIGNLR